MANGIIIGWIGKERFLGALFKAPPLLLGLSHVIRIPVGLFGASSDKSLNCPLDGVANGLDFVEMTMSRCLACVVSYNVVDTHTQ